MCKPTVLQLYNRVYFNVRNKYSSESYKTYEEINIMPLKTV